MSEPLTFAKINNNPECYSLDNEGVPRLYVSTNNNKEYVVNLLNNSDFFEGLKVAIFPNLKPSWDFKFFELEDSQAFVSFIYKRFPSNFDISLSIKEDSELQGVYLHKPNSNKRLDIQKRLLLAIKKVAPIDSRHDTLLINPLQTVEAPVHDENLWTETVWFANHNVRAFDLVIPEKLDAKQKNDIVNAALKEAINYLKNDFDKEVNPVLCEVVRIGSEDVPPVTYRAYLEDILNITKSREAINTDIVKIDTFLSREAAVFRYAELMKKGEWDWKRSPVIGYTFGDSIRLVDGSHRVLAAEAAGSKQVPLILIDDIIDSAIASINSNSTSEIRFFKV